MEYLNDKEKRVLASLYTIEEKIASNIAKATLINRTSLYPILKRLIVKGLVSAVGRADKTVFSPISKIQFKAWLEKKQKESQKSAHELEDWLNKLDEKNVSLVSEISYFEGISGVENLYADTWRNNEGKIIYCITDYQAAADTMENFFRKDYLPKRVTHGIKVKSLVTESPVARKDQKTTHQFLREMKFAKDLFKDLEIEINIYDNKVAIIAYDQKNPSGVLIKNAKIASAMKNIFNYIWKKEK